MKIYIFIFFVCCVFSLKVFSQQDAPTKKDFAGHINTDVPQSAGFALLGVTPEKVIDPQGGKEFGAALLQGLDQNGNFHSGFALDTRPFLWGQGEYIEERNLRSRILSGFKFSFASTEGVDDEDKASRYGLGVNWSYQFNEPFMNKEYVRCGQAVTDKVVPPIPDASRTEEQMKSELSKGIKDCGTKYLSWPVNSISAGVAAHKSKEDSINISESGYGVWLTGSHSLGRRAEITGHFRYVENQLSVTKDGLAQSDVQITALRLRFGSDSVKGILESSWNVEESSLADDEYSLISLGTEFKVQENTWFRIAYAEMSGASSKKDEGVFTGQLRFGFGNAPLSAF